MKRKVVKVKKINNKIIAVLLTSTFILSATGCTTNIHDMLVTPIKYSENGELIYYSETEKEWTETLSNAYGTKEEALKFLRKFNQLDNNEKIQEQYFNYSFALLLKNSINYESFKNVLEALKENNLVENQHIDYSKKLYSYVNKELSVEKYHGITNPDNINDETKSFIEEYKKFINTKYGNKELDYDDKIGVCLYLMLENLESFYEFHAAVPVAILKSDSTIFIESLSSIYGTKEESVEFFKLFDNLKSSKTLEEQEEILFLIFDKIVDYTLYENALTLQGSELIEENIFSLGLIIDIVKPGFDYKSYLKNKLLNHLKELNPENETVKIIKELKGYNI